MLNHYILFRINPALKGALHFKPWKETQSQEILRLNDSDGFSVAFMLVPTKIDTASILVGTQFMEVPKKLDFPPCVADLCDANHRPGRIRLWDGWDFLHCNISFEMSHPFSYSICFWGTVTGCQTIRTYLRLLQIF